jgi:hypothetical protein
MSLVTIGDVEELVDESYSGFAYPARKTQMPLLETDDDTSGNVVIQEGSKPYRQATISVVVESTVDMELIRGYEESGDEVTFVDRSGDERTVLVFAFGQAARAGDDAWDVTLTLLELVPPVALGS